MNATTTRDDTLLGRMAVAANNARYEWHSFCHGGDYYRCNQGECQEAIALYDEYCKARAAESPTNPDATPHPDTHDWEQ